MTRLSAKCFTLVLKLCPGLKEWKLQIKSKISNSVILKALHWGNGIKLSFYVSFCDFLRPIHPSSLSCNTRKITCYYILEQTRPLPLNPTKHWPLPRLQSEKFLRMTYRTRGELETTRCKITSKFSFTLCFHCQRDT